MQIQRIKAKNFKTYLELDLDLSVEVERPIILIGGMNGGGKTTMFEAICGALYGLKIKDKNHFAELFNNGVPRDAQSKIELELVFTGQVLNQTQKYILRRTYMLNPAGKPVESVYLNMNGSIFSYGTATPVAQRLQNENQVNKIIKANLPEELSQYFLFDAMQSSKLLEENVFAQIIRDNIQNVMGFNKYVQLNRCTQKLTQDKSLERLKAEKEIQEYEKLCEDKKELEEQVVVNEAAQDTIYKYLTAMKSAYDQAKAGAEDQEHVKLQIQQLDSTIDDTKKRANEFVDKMKDFINNIEVNLCIPKLYAGLAPEIETILRSKEALKKGMESQYSVEVIEEITAKVIDYLKQFSLCATDVDAKNVSSHIAATQHKVDQEDKYGYLDDMDVVALREMKRVNSINEFTQLDAKRKEIDEAINELKNQQIQRETLQSSITQGNTALIKEYEENKVELERLNKESADLKEQIRKLENRIHTYDVQIQQEPDVKYDTLVKLTPFFEDVANTLLASKKAHIEKEMQGQLNELLISYKGYIDRVELTDRLDNFSIKLYHKKGNEISLNQLNAASKQIFIQVLLKVLRNLGDYNPPVMIDTVMGVLDEESRDVLMEMYFPQLAEQTILLCTTSEIRKDSDYKKLEPFISRTYTLHRNVEEQCTSLTEDYFGIQLSY